MRCVAVDRDVCNASLSVLEHDVLKLLNVPISFRERLEAVRQHANFVLVADAHLHVRFHWRSRINPVLLVDFAFGRELANDAHCFLTDSALSLVGAGTAVVRAVDARMACQGVFPFAGLS